MNKTYAVVSGTVVVSLAAGVAGGYFLAKKKFEKTLDDLLGKEVQKTQKFYERLLEESKKTIEDLKALRETIDLRVESEKPVPEIEEDEESSDSAVVKALRETRAEHEATRALTNYQGFAAKPPLEDVVSKNIFTDKPKKKLPPRDPETGRFGSVQPKGDFADRPREHVTHSGPELTPYMINHDAFLVNDPEHEQESLLYFRKDETLLQVDDQETVDIARVGEVNLTLFPEVADGEASLICVRNEGLGIDYQITLTDESLTVYMGLGEDDADLDQD